MVVVAVIEPALLAAVDLVVGRVDVQNEPRRPSALPRVDERLEQHGLQRVRIVLDPVVAARRTRGRGMLQTVQRALARQCRAVLPAPFELAGQQRQQRVVPQLGTSASRFAANQLRLLFSAFASILFQALRRALHGTRLARATAGTLRLKLLKIGARVTVSMRRVKVAMDSAHPSAAAFARVHARLPG